MVFGTPTSCSPGHHLNGLFTSMHRMHRIFFRKRLACNPGHPQVRTGSSPEPASGAGTSRPVHPVHPVHRCSYSRITQCLSGTLPDPWRIPPEPSPTPSCPFVDIPFYSIVLSVDPLPGYLFSPPQKKGSGKSRPLSGNGTGLPTGRRTQAVAFSFLPPKAFTSIFFGRAAGARGTVISRTPLLKEAAILSRSVPFGKSRVCS